MEERKMKKVMKALALALACVLAVETPISVSATGVNAGVAGSGKAVYQAGDNEGTHDGGTHDGGTHDGGTHDGGTHSGSDPQVIAIAIKGDDSYDLRAGDTITLEANVVAIKDFKYEVKWSVDGDAAVITEAKDKICKVMAVKGGTAKVTATAGNRSDSVTVHVSATELSFKQAEYTYYLKQKIDMFEELNTDAASRNEIFWSVSNKKLASVDKKGVVTMKKVSDPVTPVILTAVTEDGLIAQTAITIEEGNPVKKITLSEKKVVLSDLGETKVITATVVAKDEGKPTTDKLVWTSAKDTIVTVEGDAEPASGKAEATLEAVGVGKAKVTIKASTGKSASLTVTANATVDHVEIEGTADTYPKKKVTLYATRYDKKGNELPENSGKLKWVIDPASKKIASVSGKKGDTAIVTVKTKKLNEGETQTIIVKAQINKEEKGSFELTVNPSGITDLKPIEGEKELYVGEETWYSAEAVGGSAEEITWTSSNSKVLTIDEEGHAVALKAGKVTVKGTVTLANGNTKSQPIKVTVTQPITELAMKKTMMVVQAGKKKNVTFTAVKLPKGSKGDVTYSVTDGTEIASVGNPKKGKVAVNTDSKAGDTVTVEAKTVDRYDNEVTAEGTILVIDGKKLTLTFGAGKKITLKQGEEKNLEAKLSPDTFEAVDEITYSVSKKGIVSVDEDGTVKALTPGTVKVTAKSASGAKAVVTIKVTDAKVEGGTHDGGTHDGGTHS